MTAPALFPALPPHLVPGLDTLHAQLPAALLDGVAEYAQVVALRSHAEAVRSIAALCALLPPAASIAAVPEAVQVHIHNRTGLADDAAHDRYCRVRRVSEPEGVAFLRSVLLATGMFHAEMHASYPQSEQRLFAEVGLGLAALLAYIAGVEPPAVEHSEPDPQALPPPIDPMWRWVLGHQIFVALTQGLIFALQEFEAAIRRWQENTQRSALKLAVDLMTSSATSFRFTADFAAEAYANVVRPSMMGKEVGEGFSGLLSVDHRRLVAVLTRIRPLMGQTAQRFAAEHERLTAALNHVYGDHRFVCTQFGGAKTPSLLCPRSSPLPGSEQLDRYRRARGELLRPGSGGEPVILE